MIGGLGRFRILKAIVGSFALLLIGAFAVPDAHAQQRHDGYYYPSPQTTEVYVPRVQPSGQADRRTRIAFTTGLTSQMLAAPSPPRFAIFAKGDEAQKLIIVGLQDDAFNTLYRLRALLAMLTAYARSSPAFQGHPNPENLTFLDLVALIGFRQVTISDGREVAHRITFGPTPQ